MGVFDSCTESEWAEPGITEYQSAAGNFQEGEGERKKSEVGVPFHVHLQQ